MQRVRAIPLVLAVWATVVSTVLAGLPHAFCVCPRTANTTTSTDQEDGPSCCCSAGKAKAKNYKTPKNRKSCCGQLEQPKEEAAETIQHSASPNIGGPQLNSAACQKQLVHLQLKSVMEKKTSEFAESFTALLTPFAEIVLIQSCIKPVENLTSSSPSIAEDLVTLLQRITI